MNDISKVFSALPRHNAVDPEPKLKAMAEAFSPEDVKAARQSTVTHRHFAPNHEFDDRRSLAWDSKNIIYMTRVLELQGDPEAGTLPEPEGAIKWEGTDDFGVLRATCGDDVFEGRAVTRPFPYPNEWHLYRNGEKVRNPAGIDLPKRLTRLYPSRGG